MPLHADRPPIPPLTSLRFFAAAIVVAYHYEPERFTRVPEFLRSWLETGYEAVTFFFMLSGFVLAYVYHPTGPGPAITSLRAFFIARFGRLFPAYYVSLLLALPFFVVPGFFQEGETPSPHIVSDALLVLTGLQTWWPPAALAWNPPGWSVSVEWFMYGTFPVILWATRNVSAGRLLVGSFVIVVVVALFRVNVMKPLVEEDAQTWYHFAEFFPLFHLPQFVFGMAVGRVHLESARLPPAMAAWLFAAGLAGLMILFVDLHSLPSRMRSNALLVTFFAMMIVGAANPGHFAYRVLSAPALLYLGDISYSIYAVHQPLEFWWEWTGPLAFDVRMPASVDFMIFFVIVLVAAALCYRFVEMPLRRRIRRWGGVT